MSSTFNYTINQLQLLRESEDHVEFKEAKHNFPWNGGSHSDQKERRKCFLGYIIALSNEGGGLLVFGMKDKTPHQVVGSDFAHGKIGELEDAVYDKLQIRVHLHELYDENGLRVLVTEIPARPKGRLMKFEGVALMRTGDSLRNMSDDEMFKILSEQEPDFSATICKGFETVDIDQNALSKLKESYSKKQNNPTFQTLPLEQVLTDLHLMTSEGLTYAALILLGKEDALKQHLPNAQMNIEIRQTITQTHFDKREKYIKPLFLTIDEVWEHLNSRNRDNKIEEGPYKFDLPFFNQEVIRESVLNAMAHRDYSIASEIVIKQFPDRITITNPGGFPKGVNLDNLIRINSTPRSRLLTDILEKTGLVERSGQGVDKIFRITISEGKPLPDYTKTDFFQVELTLIGEVEDKAFAAFINKIQDDRDKDNQLGIFQIMALYLVKNGKSEKVDDLEVLNFLDNEGFIRRAGGNASEKYVLSETYFDLKNDSAEIAGFRTIDLERILSVLSSGIGKVKMADFLAVFENDLSRDQVRYLVDKLIGRVMEKNGAGSGTSYSLKTGIKNLNDVKQTLENE